LDTACVDHGCKGSRGEYSTCWYGGRYIGKHVRALIIHTGEQPNGRFALHSCDNKRCINPEHLRWGTHSDNMKDAVERGRHANNLRNFAQTENRKRGAEQRAARWTELQVLTMRACYAAGETQTSIAGRFGCRQSDVSRIVRKEYWKHI
jgi:hypothetical protein